MTSPRTVGRYELVTSLAAGSLGGLWMSRVASGPEEGRVVTVRSIERPAALTDSALAPLTAVGFSAMELRHPAVAAVLDVVVAGNAIAIVSEHLEGTLLSGICQQGARAKASPGVAARIALDLLDGLVAVKPAWDEVAPPPPSGTNVSSPSIHGGLLPDGVLVATFGEAMILEVGVAAAAMSIQALRDRAEVLAYRAPEQLEEGGSADERADVFTLGAMIWELIAGRPLFGLPPAPPLPAGAPPPPRSASAATVRRNVKSAPIPRLDSLPGIQPVSPALADFVQKCLERDRTRRHQTLSDAAEALRKLGVAAPHQEVARLLVSLRSQPGESELTPTSTRPTSPPEDRDRETMAPETRRPVNADGGGASPAGTGPREDAKTLSVPPIAGDAPRAARESTLSVEPESVEPVSAEPVTAPKPAGGRPTSIRPRSFVPKDLHPKGGKTVSQPPPQAAGVDIPPPPPAFFSALESLPPPSGANFFPAPETASAAPVVKPPAAAAARVASAPPEKRSGGGKIAIVVVAVVAVIVIALLVLRSGSDEARPEPAPAKANVASPAATPRAPEPAPLESGTVAQAAPVAPSAAPEPEAPAEPASPPAGSAAPSGGMAAAPAPVPGAPAVRLQPVRPASSAAKKPFRPSDI